MGIVLAVTVKPACNDGELWEILSFAARHGEVIRGVHFQPTSQRARRAVALKWAAAPRTEVGSGYNVDSLDAFLQTRKRHSLAVSGMAFQDAWTLDLQRLQRCHVHVVSPLGELIPFCAYNLTAQDGTTLYR